MLQGRSTLEMLSLALLGQPEVSIGGDALPKFRTSRAQALLCYLATEFALGTSHQSRESLMELLWPGMPPESARMNLRQNLYYLRQSLPVATSSSGGEPSHFLLSDRQTIAVNAQYPLDFDVQRFIKLSAGSPEDWLQAVALYRGDFLAGFYLSGANPFEEWATARREAFRRQALNAMEGLTDSFIVRGRFDDGEQYARRQLEIDPLREPAYRQLMKVLYYSDRRAEALKLYQECIRILEEELSAQPSEATASLANAVRDGTLAGSTGIDEPQENTELMLGDATQVTSGMQEHIVELLPSAEHLASTVRNNLPIAVTPFVGREKELSALNKLIIDPQVRIITILGPGGIGKTRLALEVASRQLSPSSPFSDGVFFVSLAPLESAEEIESLLISTLNLRLQGTKQTTSNERQQVLDYLTRRKMLLVLDNFEHILEGRALVGEIGQLAPGVNLLVTSRERLQLRGEQVFPIYGLEMPGDDGSALTTISDYAAAQLFLNVARQSMPGFELLEGDAAQILHICRLVEGMPLGLELAASWAGLLPLADIAGEIEQSMQLLHTKHHDVPRRHRSMQATLDLSWKRLSAQQKRAFQELTVFRGGFGRSAALEVAGADLSLLVAMVNKSWLSYERKNDRYHIHELLRQYGNSKLKTDTSLEHAVGNRHSAFFCGYLKEREADWFSAREQEAAAEVRVEIENIQSAWRWAVSQADVDLLAQGIDSLGRFYNRDMRKTAGEKAFRSAAYALSNLPAVQENADRQKLTLWSRVLCWQAHFTDQLDQRQMLLRQSQDILDRVTATGRDTRAEQAFIFLEQAHATGKRDYEASIRFCNLALKLFRELGERAGEAQVLMRLGLDYRRLGKTRQAYDALSENLAIRQELNDQFGAAEAMHWLSMAAFHELKLDEAKRLSRQALHIFRRLGTRYYEAEALIGLSIASAHAGENLGAEKLIDQALALERDSGLSENLWIHFMSANIKLALGRIAEAKAEVHRSLDAARQQGLSEESGAGLETLGDIATVEGDFELAKRYYQESIYVYKEVMDVNLFRVQAGLGYVARFQGDESLARQYLYNSISATRDYECLELALAWLPLAMLVAIDEDQPDRALELYSLARHIGFINNSRYWEVLACRELDDVRASLPAEVVAAADARGHELDLKETIEELLVDLTHTLMM